jgi:HK97 family phage portal protein
MGFLRFIGLESRSAAPRSVEADDEDVSQPLTVNHKTALSVAAVLRAVSIISGDVAKLPVHVYRQGVNGHEKISGDPAGVLFKPSMEQEQIPFHSMRAAQANAMLNGNGYLYVRRNAAMEPVELIPLPARPITYPVRKDGKIYYMTQDAHGRQVDPIPATDVIHIRGLGFGGLEGDSVITIGAEAIGVAMASQRYGANFFKNGASPSMILESPAWLNDEQRAALREAWKKSQSGLRNAHGLFLMGGGMKAVPFSVNAKDAQLIERCRFSITEIANLFGLPPHLLGDSSKAGYNSLEAENQSYLQQSLDPWLVAWEQELTRKLLSPEKIAEGYFVAFQRAALVRPDLSARYGAYTTGINARFLTPNEVRAWENLPPIEGGDVMISTTQAAPAASPSSGITPS